MVRSNRSNHEAVSLRKPSIYICILLQLAVVVVTSVGATTSQVIDELVHHTNYHITSDGSSHLRSSVTIATKSPKSAAQLLLPSCDLKCANGGTCSYISDVVSTLQIEFQKGTLIQQCSCPSGYTGIACEIHQPNSDCQMSDKRCFNGMACMKAHKGLEYSCDCAVPMTVSTFAGSMCIKPYTEYCADQFYPNDSSVSFCTNGGKCQSSFLASQIAPRNTSINILYQNNGCVCPKEYYGPHCEFLRYGDSAEVADEEKSSFLTVRSESFDYSNWTKPDLKMLTTGNPKLDALMREESSSSVSRSIDYGDDDAKNIPENPALHSTNFDFNKKTSENTSNRRKNIFIISIIALLIAGIVGVMVLVALRFNRRRRGIGTDNRDKAQMRLFSFFHRYARINATNNVKELEQSISRALVLMNIDSHPKRDLQSSNSTISSTSSETSTGLRFGSRTGMILDELSVYSSGSDGSGHHRTCESNGNKCHATGLHDFGILEGSESTIGSYSNSSLLEEQLSEHEKAATRRRTCGFDFSLEDDSSSIVFLKSLDRRNRTRSDYLARAAALTASDDKTDAFSQRNSTRDSVGQSMMDSEYSVTVTIAEVEGETDHTSGISDDDDNKMNRRDTKISKNSDEAKTSSPESIEPDVPPLFNENNGAFDVVVSPQVQVDDKSIAPIGCNDELCNINCSTEIDDNRVLDVDNTQNFSNNYIIINRGETIATVENPQEVEAGCDIVE